MASTLKHLRSSSADKRPTASGLADGQLAINTASGTPGLFFKDSNSEIVKVGPAHVGASAPNATPAGSAGNSTGEFWVDNGLVPSGLKVWNGNAFSNLTPSGSETIPGLLEVATPAEVQTGTDHQRAVTPSGLQSKISDSTATTSSTTIASSTAVKSAYDLANAALPKTGGTVTGELLISPSGSLVFEGSSDDSFETTIAVTNPTADRTITFPNVTGNVVTTGDSGTVTSTMILNDTIVNADINSAAAIAHSKLANITAGSVLLGNASNVPTATALSGDVTINSSGVTAISAGVIVNADVNASAAIAGTKISPNFGSQNVTTTGTVTGASLSPTSSTVPSNGIYLPAANTVGIATNTVSRVTIDGSGTVAVTNNLNIDNGTLFVDAANNRVGINTTTTVYNGTSIGDLTLASNAQFTNPTQLFVNTNVGQSTALGEIRFHNNYYNASARITASSNITLTSLSTISDNYLGQHDNYTVYAGNGTTYYMYINAARFAAMGAGSVEAIVVDKATDRVGIYDVSPDAKLTVNGIASFGAGAAATPSIAARGDLDTGIYFPGANQVAISTGGTSRLQINSSGTLELAGTAGNSISINGNATANRFSVDGSGNIGIGTAAAGNAPINIVSPTGPAIMLGANNGAYFGAVYGATYTADEHFFNSPTAGYSYYKAFVAGPNGVPENVFNDDGANLDFRVEGDTKANLFFVDASTDRVGVGTSSPGSLLQVGTGALSSTNIAAFLGGSTTFENVTTGNNPSITFNNDTDTGILNPSANTLGINTGGNRAITIDSSQRVGIGTALCGAPLSFADTNALKIQFNGDAANFYGISKLAGGGNLGDGEFRLTAGNTSAGGFTFASGGSERARITSAGLVGIGTGAPQALLELAANNNTPGTDPLAANNRLRFTDTDTTKVNSQVNGGIEWYTADSSDPGVYAYIASATTLAGAGWISFATGTNTTKTERVRIDQSGNVGIGTTSPNGSLDVVSDSGGIAVNIRNRTANDYGYLRFQNNAGSSTQASIGNLAGVLSFETGTTERARIDSSGRLLVGTSSSTADAIAVFLGRSGAPGGTGGEIKLAHPTTNVPASGTLGRIQFGNTSDDRGAEIAAIASQTWTSTAKGSFLTFSTTANNANSPTERMRINSSGDVGIGAISGTFARLHVRAANSDTLAVLLRLEQFNAAGTDSARLEIQADAANNLVTYNSTGLNTGGHAFQTGGTERARIDSSGRLGIGTSSPTALLHVNGDSRFVGPIRSNTIISDVDVANAGYDGVSFSVGSQETNPNGLFFSPDGRKMFVIGSSGDDINEYTLSTPWDVSTATFVTVFSVASQDTNPQDLYFRNDGKKLYVVGGTNDEVDQYTLSTPWSIASASYDSVSLSVTTEEAIPTGLFFKPDGLKMYIVGETNDTVYCYFLQTAWNPATAIGVDSFSVSGQESTARALSFTADGSRMFVMGSTGDDVNIYNLTTPWDITTASFVTVFSVSTEETAPSGLFVKPDGTKFYIVGTANDTVYQYTIPSVTIDLTGTTNINGSAEVAQDLTVRGDIVGGGKLHTQSSTAGIGYITGAGGAVTQATSRTTGVTLNRICGAITLVSAAGSTSWQSFTVTNSTVAATDTVIVNQKSGTNLYMIHVTNVAAGSFKISFATTGGTTTEQPVFNFSVLKAVAA